MLDLKIIDAAVFDDDVFFKNHYEELSQYRKTKIGSKQMRRDKNLSLAASVLLKELLKNNFQIDEKKLEYHENGAGKPYIAGLNNVFFSLSHSRNLAACAISNKPIGIDIEVKRSINLEIAKRFFTINEINFILNIKNNEERVKSFFRIWTLKESYIKCIGKTLASQIQQIDTLDIIKGAKDEMQITTTPLLHIQETQNLEFKYKFEEKHTYDYFLSICSLT